MHLLGISLLSRHPSATGDCRSVNLRTTDRKNTLTNLGVKLMIRPKSIFLKTGLNVDKLKDDDGSKDPLTKGKIGFGGYGLVYTCFKNEDNCPGGTPGYKGVEGSNGKYELSDWSGVCADKTRDDTIGCFKCVEGFYRNMSTGECIKCHGAEWPLLIILMYLQFFFCVNLRIGLHLCRI